MDLNKDLLFNFSLAFSGCNAQVGHAHLDKDDVLHILVAKPGKSDKIKQFALAEGAINDTGKFTYVPNSTSDYFPLKWTVLPETYTLLSSEFFPNRFGPSVFHKFNIERQDSLAVKKQKIALIDSLTRVHGSRSLAIAALGLPQAVDKKNMLFQPFQQNYKKYNEYPGQGDLRPWAFDFKYRDANADSILAILRLPRSLQRWVLDGKEPSFGELKSEIYPTIGAVEMTQKPNTVDSLFFSGEMYLHISEGIEILINLSSGYLYDVSDGIKAIGRMQFSPQSGIFLLSDSKRKVLWVSHPVNWLETTQKYGVAYYRENNEIMPIMEFLIAGDIKY